MIPENAGASPALDDDRSWVALSDARVLPVLEAVARFEPEPYAECGLPGFDTEVFQCPPDLRQRQAALYDDVRRTFERALAEESHPQLRADSALVAEEAERRAEHLRLEDATLVPYFDLAGQVYSGLRVLLAEDDPERRRAAQDRLRRYTGSEEGYAAVARQAEEALRARLGEPGLLPPWRETVERDLVQLPLCRDALRRRFAEAGLDDGGLVEKLQAQLTSYEGFVRSEVLPRSREGFRLPAELYASRLADFGVDMPLDEMARRAGVAYREARGELETLAPLVARENALAEESDWRGVVRELRRRQVSDEDVIACYERRIAQIEAWIEDAGLVTLPPRSLRLRRAGRVESAAAPFPHLRRRCLVGSPEEPAEMVLPGRSSESAATEAGYTFDAVTWVLAAHEARPGHEMHFAALRRGDVPLARKLFSFNVALVEGWAVYAEGLVKRFLPLAGQLITVQRRLLRAARTWLDPALHQGRVAPAEAIRLLEREVALAPGEARQELWRMTSWAPGQGTTYFCGNARLVELAAEAEWRLGRCFVPRRFHDAVVAAGLVPFEWLRRKFG